MKNKNTKSWNPFVGCLFSCSYCKPSFQYIVNRLGREINCPNCITYTPHEHPLKIEKLPSDKTIFVCEDGDISFAEPSYMAKIFDVMRSAKTQRNWILQSKNPACFNQYLSQLPKNTYLTTTLETNRNISGEISKAPQTSERYNDFKTLKWDKKFVTIEPIMDFDLSEFAEMILSINPKCCFVGYNSKPNFIKLPEPSKEKTLSLITSLENYGIKVLTKDMRDPNIPHYAYRNYFEGKTTDSGNLTKFFLEPETV